MATRAVIVEELMQEFGKTGHDSRVRVDRFVGEVVLNILNQNKSRFRRLQKRKTLTFNVDDTQKKLPSDFKMHAGELVEVDSDSLFVAELDVLDDNEFFRRKAERAQAISTYFRVETKQTPTPGEYLIANASFTETRFFEVPYYRKASQDDADIIDDPGIIKDGVRAKQFTGVESAKHMTVYETAKKGLIEHPGERATGQALMPNKQQRILNRRMHDIGRGN